MGRITRPIHPPVINSTTLVCGLQSRKSQMCSWASIAGISAKVSLMSLNVLMGPLEDVGIRLVSALFLPRVWKTREKTDSCNVEIVESQFDRRRVRGDPKVPVVWVDKERIAKHRVVVIPKGLPLFPGCRLIGRLVCPRYKIDSRKATPVVVEEVVVDFVDPFAFKWRVSHAVHPRSFS